MKKSIVSISDVLSSMELMLFANTTNAHVRGYYDANGIEDGFMTSEQCVAITNCCEERKTGVHTGTFCLNPPQGSGTNGTMGYVTSVPSVGPVDTNGVEVSKRVLNV